MNVAQYEIANQNLKAEIQQLQERLELVADIIAKHGFIKDTPAEKYRFVHGAPLQNFPVRGVSVITDLDGEESDAG